ncbi:hypothetical protein JCM9279_004088 [Rhodotorula babjevae]
MFHFTTTLRSPARTLRSPSSSASPVLDRLTAQRGLQARKAASAERKRKVKSLKDGKLTAIQGDQAGAATKVERPITPISNGTDATKSSTDTAQLKSLVSSESSSECDSTAATSGANTIKPAASASAANSISHEAGLSSNGSNWANSNSAPSTYSLDDNRESALSLAGSAWTADSDDDVFYDAVEEQPLDGIVRNVEVGNWVERVLATPLLIPDRSDAEYAEDERKEQERRAKYALEDAAKAAKVVVEVVPEVVEQPRAHEPLPLPVVHETTNYLSLVQAELARQAVNNAIELFSTVAAVEPVEPVVEMEVDPVPMDLDFPSSASSSVLILNDDDMDVDDVLMEIDLEPSTEDRMDIDEPVPSSFSFDYGPCAMDIDEVYTPSFRFSASPAGATVYKPAPSAVKVNKQHRRPAARAPLPDQRGAFLGRSVISPLGVKLHVPNGMGSSQIKFNAPGRVFENMVAASLGKVDRQAAPVRRAPPPVVSYGSDSEDSDMD